MKKAILVFNLKAAFNIINNHQNIIRNNDILIITDKVTIYNLFIEFKKEVECLDFYFKGKIKKKIFLKNYRSFENFLYSIGKKLSYTNKTNLNTFYYSYNHHLSRLYAGIKFILISLSKISKKKKIKKIIFINDIETTKSDILSNNFFDTIFDYFCFQNNIKYKSIKLPIKKNNPYFYSFKKKIYFFIYLLEEINFNSIKIKFKKFISNYIFIKSRKENLILEPAYDINYANIPSKKNFYIDIEKKFFSKVQSIKEISINFDPKQHNNEKSIIKDFLLQIDLKINQNFKEALNYFLKIISYFKFKKIFWGLSPNYFKRNLIFYLKKKMKIKILGFQHGGSYFISQKDELHRNSEYMFCDEYISYGYSKFFEKRKYLKKTKLINNGCFKENYITRTIKNVDCDTRKILYVPISLSNFWKPNLQSSQHERFEDQKKICKFLNNIKNFKSYIKFIPNTLKKNTIINYYNLETNPIYLYSKNYKNLYFNSNSLIKAFTLIRPKIIIFDSFSTPTYELLNSKSELIVFIDRINPLKKDVLEFLKQRCFVVSSIQELNKAVNLIEEKKSKKILNKNFFNKFYKNKNNFNYK